MSSQGTLQRIDSAVWAKAADDRRRASTNLQKKLLELAALQDKIYELRFSSSLPEADLKARLGALLGEMLRLQDQISTGLTQDVADFQQLVAMEGVVPILPVEDSPSASRSRPSSNASTPVLGRSRSNSSASLPASSDAVNPSANPADRLSSGWGILSSLTAVKQWKNFTSTKKTRAAVDEILARDDRDSENPREDLSTLRAALVQLRIRKNLSDEDMIFKRNVERQLKRLEEQIGASHSSAHSS